MKKFGYSYLTILVFFQLGPSCSEHPAVGVPKGLMLNDGDEFVIHDSNGNKILVAMESGITKMVFEDNNSLTVGLTSSSSGIVQIDTFDTLNMRACLDKDGDGFFELCIVDRMKGSQFSIAPPPGWNRVDQNSEKK